MGAQQSNYISVGLSSLRQKDLRSPVQLNTQRSEVTHEGTNTGKAHTNPNTPCKYIYMYVHMNIYGIFAYIGVVSEANVGIYSIRGMSGKC